METIIQRTIKLLLDSYQADYAYVTVSEESGHYMINIETDHPPKLIGRNGSVLNALQTLLKNLLWKQCNEKVFVTLDVDGYRRAQHERIYAKVQKTIDLMREQGLSEIKLKPMHPATRRLVHLWLVKSHPDLTSDSVGEGKDRAIRVYYK